MDEAARPLVLFLRVQPDQAGGWTVVAGALGRVPANGYLNPVQVAEIVSRIHTLLIPPPMSVPGRVARRVQAEERAGRLLGRALELPAVAREIAWLRGQAHGQGRALLVLVDPQDAEVARLPWELLAWSEDGTPIASGDGSTVVRLARGTSAALRGPADRLRPLVWCPDAEEAACERRLAALLALWRRLDLDLVVLPRDLAAPRAPDPRVADVLHLVCHGDLLDGESVLLVGDGDQAPGAAVALLGQILPSVSLVVLDVCIGGSPSRAQLRTLAGRYLRAGAPACVAPAGTLAVEASEAFSAGLYARLAAGGTLPQAVEEGRREVVRLAHPHPDHRPSNLLLYVTSADVAAADPLLEDPWRPAGWPRVSAEVRQVLRAARKRARRLGHGWLGAEHLLPELLDARCDRSAALRSLIPSATPEVWSHFGSPVKPPVVDNPEPTLTPRLAALGGRVPEGCDLEALWVALLADPGLGLHAMSLYQLGGITGREETTHTLLRSPSTEAATVFEVVWGPADGQRVRPAVGETIGRPSSDRGPDQPIGAGLAQVPHGCSRRHLRYLGPGRVEALQGLEVLKVGDVWNRATRVPAGPLEVCVGEVLALVPGLWLWGDGER